MPKKETYNEQSLRDLARNDPLMHQLMCAYDAGRFTNREEFLTCAVLTLAEVKNALHKRIEELYADGIPPIVFQVSPEELENVKKQLKR